MVWSIFTVLKKNCDCVVIEASSLFSQENRECAKENNMIGNSRNISNEK